MAWLARCTRFGRCCGPPRSLVPPKRPTSVVPVVHTQQVAPCGNARFMSSKSDSEGASVTTANRIGLELNKVDKDMFTSKSLWVPGSARGVYGGQVVGQALTAVTASVDDPTITIHSMHSYFMLPGDASRPIVYMVKRLRDGNSFATRSVDAMQNGKCIFSCMCSFHKPEPGLVHQESMPENVPEPMSVPSFDDTLRKVGSNPDISPKWKAVIDKLLAHPFGMEVRDITLHSGEFAPDGTQLVWMRAAPLGDDQNVHRCVAAYASDWGLGVTTLRAHGLTFPHTTVKMVASLDHSVWFHSREFRADEWLLFKFSSPRSSDSRGLNFGHLFTQSGELVMTVAQEALIRLRDAPSM